MRRVLPCGVIRSKALFGKAAKAALKKIERARFEGFSRSEFFCF
jgi:hypothetical protein